MRVKSLPYMLRVLQKYSGGKWLKCYRNTAGEGVDAQSDALVKPKQLVGL